MFTVEALAIGALAAYIVGLSKTGLPGSGLIAIPLFAIALGLWTDGGHFFTRQSLLYDLFLVPAIVLGVYSGRALFHLLPQRTFLVAVLVLSAGGALELLL